MFSKKKYKFNKLIPFNKKIPFRLGEVKSYFTIYQSGKVSLYIEGIKEAKLIYYKKHKIKIQFKRIRDARDYRIKLVDKIPLEYRSRLRFIGYIYFYFANGYKCNLDKIFIYNSDLMNSRSIQSAHQRISNVTYAPAYNQIEQYEFPPSYDSVIHQDNLVRQVLSQEHHSQEQHIQEQHSQEQHNQEQHNQEQHSLRRQSQNQRRQSQNQRRQQSRQRQLPPLPLY